MLPRNGLSGGAGLGARTLPGRRVVSSAPPVGARTDTRCYQVIDRAGSSNVMGKETGARCALTSSMPRMRSLTDALIAACVPSSGERRSIGG